MAGSDCKTDIDDSLSAEVEVVEHRCVPSYSAMLACHGRCPAAAQAAEVSLGWQHTAEVQVEVEEAEGSLDVAVVALGVTWAAAEEHIVLGACCPRHGAAQSNTWRDRALRVSPDGIQWGRQPANSVQDRTWQLEAFVVYS
jgi:hypothetical protein